jgi:hypothetical protein
MKSEKLNYNNQLNNNNEIKSCEQHNDKRVIFDIHRKGGCRLRRFFQPNDRIQLTPRQLRQWRASPSINKLFFEMKKAKIIILNKMKIQPITSFVDGDMDAIKFFRKKTHVITIFHTNWIYLSDKKCMIKQFMNNHNGIINSQMMY